MSIMMCKRKSVSIHTVSKIKRTALFVTEQIRYIIGLIRSCYALLQILVTDTKARDPLRIRINLSGAEWLRVTASSARSFCLLTGTQKGHVATR